MYEVRALPHAAQPKMSAAPVITQVLRINAFPVIADAHPKLPFVIADFHLDALRSSMTESVAKSFSRCSVDFVTQDRMQILRWAFHVDGKMRPFGTALGRPQVLRQAF